MRYYSILGTIIVFTLLPPLADSCGKLKVIWDSDGAERGKQDATQARIFTLKGDVSLSGRPVYESSGGLLLYHIILDTKEGAARWMVGHEIESRSGIAYVDSWAVAPHSIADVSPKAKWTVHHGHHRGSKGWTVDAMAQVDCIEEGGDTTVYLCSQLNQGICGFFFPTTPTVPRQYTSTGIGLGDRALNLYSIFIGPADNQTRRWMISHDAPGAQSGVAFIDCDADNPAAILTLCNGSQWSVSTHGTWKQESRDTFLHLAAAGSESVFRRLRSSQLFRPSTGHGVELNNGMYFPTVGLGTGGLNRPQTESTLTQALVMGYRLVDSASAYQNEDVVGRVLRTQSARLQRRHVAVTTKLWPTHLGFEETLSEFTQSLNKLQTGYIDLYMLHWPDCYDHFSWMDCSKRSNGNWRQSYRALEKLYAEGRTRAIGVSNFDNELMKQLLSFGVVVPQVLQNHMDPVVQQGADVLQLCTTHSILFQAYSVLRSVTAPGRRATYQRVWEVATRIGAETRQSPGQVLLRWALQRGGEHLKVGVIPRTTKPERLRANLEAGDPMRPLESEHEDMLASAASAVREEL